MHPILGGLIIGTLELVSETIGRQDVAIFKSPCGPCTYFRDFSRPPHQRASPASPLVFVAGITTIRKK